MLVRVVRAVLGSLLLLVGLPLLLAGGALWFAMQHRDAGGAYSASLAEINTDGYAVVASDVDALLRQDLPFARSGRTTLRVSAYTDAGPAFIGLAPADDVARYLADVPYTRVDQVQLARGQLPVAVAPVAGEGQPAGPPHAQPFWLATGGAGSLEWVPSELRDRQLALVVMDREAAAPLTVELDAEVRPQWLSSTTFGALVLGTVLVLVAIAVLAWPARSREIVYVVPPAEVSEVAARLGVPVSPYGGAGHRPPADPDPPPPADPPAPEGAPATGYAPEGGNEPVSDEPVSDEPVGDEPVEHAGAVDPAARSETVDAGEAGEAGPTDAVAGFALPGWPLPAPDSVTAMPVPAPAPVPQAERDAPDAVRGTGP